MAVSKTYAPLRFGPLSGHAAEHRNQHPRRDKSRSQSRIAAHERWMNVRSSISSTFRQSTFFFPRPAFLQVTTLFHVTVEEIGEERADRRDRAQTADFVPCRRNGGVHDVVGELERETCDEPARVTHPCFAHLDRSFARKHCTDCIHDRF